MKKVLYLSLAVAFAMVSCKSKPEEAHEEEVLEETTVDETEEEEEAEDFAEVNVDGFYGETFDIVEVVSLDDAIAEISDKDSLVVKLSGEVNGVCQVKGCWMTMQSGEQAMRVKFKDYGFFVPKDCSGKVAFVSGVMRREEVSIADQKHLLGDAEASQEEIDAVTEPKQELTFLASGVKIQ